MSLKDILVHVDHSPSCKERIKAALKLAQLHNAHLQVFAEHWSFTMPISNYLQHIGAS